MAKEIRYGLLITLRDQVSQGVGKIRSKLTNLSKSTEKASRYARRGLIALAGAVTAVVYAAGKQEEADIKLAAALENIGLAADDVLPDLKRYAESLQDITRYGDEAVEGAMTQMINIAGLQGEELKDATRAAIGLAAAYEMDLTTAAMLVARAAKGQTQTLTRYGIVLDMTATKEQQFAQLLEIGAEKFALAEKEARGLTGRTTQLKNRFGDLLQAIGKTIFGTDSMADTVHALQEKVKGAVEWVKDLTDAEAKQFGTVIKWGAGLLAVTAALSPLLLGLSSLIPLLAALFSPIGALVAMVTLLGLGFLGVTDALGLTETGVANLMRKFRPLDEMLTSLLESLERFKEFKEKLSPGAILRKGPLGALVSGVLAARPGHAKPETEQKIEQLWVDYFRRHPEAAERELGVKMPGVGPPPMEEPGVDWIMKPPGGAKLAPAVAGPTGAVAPETAQGVANLEKLQRQTLAANERFFQQMDRFVNTSANVAEKTQARLDELEKSARSAEEKLKRLGQSRF